MSKISNINRNLKRKKLIKKFLNKRLILKKIISSSLKNEREKHDAMIKLQKLPLNSNPIRLRNRCVSTGRSRGVFKKFGLSRCKIREFAMKGEVPGITKSSW